MLDKLLWVGVDACGLLTTTDMELVLEDDRRDWLIEEDEAEIAAAELESPPAPPQAVNTRTGKR